MSAVERDDTSADAKAAEDIEEYQERLDELREQYRFYIMNPEHKQGVEYSLWIVEDEYEYPILSSNTGGFPTFNSREQTVGDGIKPTREFLRLVGVGAHEAMAFMPSIYGRVQFQDTVESIYDGKRREYEAWAAHVIINWMTTGEQMIPEFRPLVEFAATHTEFGIPVLGEGNDE